MTNSNYSVIFRWWDAVHRTLRLNVPQSAVHIGVAAYTAEDNSLGALFRLPFAPQRDDWRTPDGIASRTRESLPTGRPGPLAD